jgi:membrane-associated PAP2 superfamily phosphatase
LNRTTRILADWVLPLAILAVASAFLRATSIDVDLEQNFYRNGWYRADDQPWSLLYHYGVIPAWVVAVGSLALLAVSRWKPSLALHRRLFLYLVLVMVVGPGLVVNTAFKEQWGRPRPMDLPQFGGDHEFVAVWDKGDPDRGQSFPSGHASTGFYFFALYFALRGRSKWAYAWLAIALGYGSIIGVARMIQGKHFLSDVVWAAGFVYLCALILYYAMRLDRATHTTEPHSQN